MIGSDPEMFVLPTADNLPQDLIVPGFIALNQRYEVPLPFGQAVPDGAAVEMVVPPMPDADSMLEALTTNFETIRQELQGIGTITLAPWGKVGKHWIRRLPPSFGKNASLQILGCDPDHNPYNIVRNRPNPKSFSWRSAGCHIHMQVPADMRLDDWESIIQLLDVTIGVVSVTHFPGEEAKERKRMYGEPGCYRIKRFSDFRVLEYRPMPSALLCSRVLSHGAFSIAEELSTLAQKGYSASDALAKVDVASIAAKIMAHEATLSDIPWDILPDTIVPHLKAMVNSEPVTNYEEILK